MQLLVVSLLLANIFTPAILGSSSQSWTEWKQKHGKSYMNLAEEIYRFQTWKNKLEMVERHNKAFRDGAHAFEIELNMFADLEPYETTKMQASSQQKGQTFIQINEGLPDSVDWSKKGIVTKVTNQGQLGSSAAYSAVGSLEGQQALKTGHLVPLSVQNLVDCVEPPLTVESCFRYIIKNEGIDTEESYPTTTGRGPCKFNPHSVGATMSSYRNISPGNETELQEAVARIGPVSATIDASQTSFELYKSGIYSSPVCSSTTLDHAVLIVGYGVENGVDYWLVKNRWVKENGGQTKTCFMIFSWGVSWGLDGYIKMSRNNDNNCGIASDAIYPVI